MGLSVVSKNAGLALIGLAILAPGCQPQQQQQTVPLHLSVINDQASPDGAAPKETPYINPDFRDNDGPSDGVFTTVLSQTGSVISTIFSPVVVLTSRSIGFFSDDRPDHAFKLMQDRSSADNRREGINKLADFGLTSSANFRKQCRLMAELDPDVTVRATAIRTCNRARDVQATPVFVAGLSNKNEWIRLESAKALANVPDVKAAEPLVELLNNRDESRDIRVAAADALKHYRTLTAARALTLALDDKNFAIAWQARRSLRYLTDRDYGYNGSAWLAYFTGPENPLK
ncbi:MAG TPA: HEAT repeat domain-containing protein [Tepidisphaeraceae bacterium]|jgi:hypothetical protein|nr:HEAT repeat domain-containing protein [Tepidisphaeraceae bacterium]